MSIKSQRPTRADPSPEYVEMLPARMCAKYLRRHVLVFNVIPFVGTVLAFSLLPWLPPRTSEVVTLAILLPLMGIGVSVGYHRYFTHRSFDTSHSVKIILAFLGSVSGQGSLASWVATHRRHHHHSDQSGDPHSPKALSPGVQAKAHAFWHAHCGWMMGPHDMANPLNYAPDVLKDPTLVWFSKQYYWLTAVGVAIPVAVLYAIDPGWRTLVLAGLWTGAFRLCLTTHVVWAINSVCHVFGSQEYSTGDESRNVAAICIPTCGESWHNNHHAFPNSARLGLKWWQFDFGWIVIRSLQLLGLVKNVKVPSRDKIESGPDGV